jgi:hypothetical protein
MRASDRAAVCVASPLSVVVGVWALGSVVFPFGVIGGAAAAAFGLAFGGLAIRAQAWGRWRKTAFVGIGASCLALLIALAEVLYVVLVEWRRRWAGVLSPDREGQAWAASHAAILSAGRRTVSGRRSASLSAGRDCRPVASIRPGERRSETQLAVAD